MKTESRPIIAGLLFAVLGLAILATLFLATLLIVSIYARALGGSLLFGESFGSAAWQLAVYLLVWFVAGYLYERHRLRAVAKGN